MSRAIPATIFEQSIKPRIITVTVGINRARPKKIRRVKVVDKRRRPMMKSANRPDKLIANKHAIYGIDDNRTFFIIELKYLYHSNSSKN